jgi:hypothetical protein
MRAEPDPTGRLAPTPLPALRSSRDFARSPTQDATPALGCPVEPLRPTLSQPKLHSVRSSPRVKELHCVRFSPITPSPP